ncbi:hypothetical protein BH09PSE4_BH09PSE4_15490 [soil metagenome]
MKVFLFACAVAALAAAPVQAKAPRPLTPATVRAMIAAQGARATVRALGGDSGSRRWQAVDAGISSGAQAWLDIVPLLKPGTDAGTSEGLATDLSTALAHNPRGVLRLLSTGLYRADAICLDTTIEPTPAFDRTYYRTTIRAVRGVTDHALRGVQAACLATLRSASHRG